MENAAEKLKGGVRIWGLGNEMKHIINARVHANYNNYP